LEVVDDGGPPHATSPTGGREGMGTWGGETCIDGDDVDVDVEGCESGE